VYVYRCKWQLKQAENRASSKLMSTLLNFIMFIFIAFSTGVVSENVSLVLPLVTESWRPKQFESILIAAFKADLLRKNS